MKKIQQIQFSNKPEYIKLDQSIDFYELFQKIEREFETCFLFESLGRYSDVSRYSVIGFGPECIVRGKVNKLVVDNVSFPCDNPYFALRNLIPQDYSSNEYEGGLVGYLGYDAANYFEPGVINVKTHEMFDPLMFGAYTDGLILDKRTNEVFYFTHGKNRSDFIKKLLSKKSRPHSVQVKFTGYTSTRDEHTQAVLYVKDQIKKGNTFQCQVGLKSEFQIKGDTIVLYGRLRKVNPSPFMFYLKFGNKKIIGASPELLFRVKKRYMETFPLAGTIRRGKNAGEDYLLSGDLLADKKEQAEHNMLVDLHRNDIGRVAEFGTVVVRSLMDIKKFSHVQHISSEIVGLLKNGEDMFSGLASNFPAGTLTGAPKIETMKIIDHIESTARGPYGGGVGNFGFNGDCTFAITIRSLFISDDYAYTQSSGGIVYDSQQEKEYEELMRKSAAMKEVLGI